MAPPSPERARVVRRGMVKLSFMMSRGDLVSLDAMRKGGRLFACCCDVSLLW